MLNYDLIRYRHSSRGQNQLQNRTQSRLQNQSQNHSQNQSQFEPRSRGREKRDYPLVSYLAGLTGSEVAEAVLIFLTRENDCYSSFIARYTGFPHQAIGIQLRRLESAGIVVKRMMGRTACYSYNRKSPWVAKLITSVTTYFENLSPEEQAAFFQRKPPGAERRSQSKRLAESEDFLPDLEPDSADLEPDSEGTED